MPLSPAESLDKMVLPNGWVVVGRANSVPGSTGSFFSVGYVVESSLTGQQAFLKALNFERILDESDDRMAALHDALRVYHFEREICGLCRGLDRVVTILDSGDVLTDPADPLTVVPYLVFEEATHDVRAFLRTAGDIDVAWALRSLHHTANGLQQLHRVDIAHQDLKPSNVLVFGRDLSKVADLGRASSRSVPGPSDQHSPAGAKFYAPPELLYGQGALEFNERRLACDMYLLGSMLCFFFTGAGATALLMQELPDTVRPKLLNGTWEGDYASALPLVQAAFSSVLQKFSNSVPPALQKDLTQILKALCDPDPSHRGHSRARISRHGNPFALDFFVSRLNALASRAEARVRLRFS